MLDLRVNSGVMVVTAAGRVVVDAGMGTRIGTKPGTGVVMVIASPYRI